MDAKKRFCYGLRIVSCIDSDTDSNFISRENTFLDSDTSDLLTQDLQAAHPREIISIALDDTKQFTDADDIDFDDYEYNNIDSLPNMDKLLTADVMLILLSEFRRFYDYDINELCKLLQFIAGKMTTNFTIEALIRSVSIEVYRNGYIYGKGETAPWSDGRWTLPMLNLLQKAFPEFIPVTFNPRYLENNTKFGYSSVITVLIPKKDLHKYERAIFKTYREEMENFIGNYLVNGTPYDFLADEIKTRIDLERLSL